MDLINKEDWRLNTADLTQQLALLLWLNKREDEGSLYKLVTSLRVWYEVYSRVSSEDEIDACRNETVLSIADYVKKNPNASKEQMTAEIAKQVQAFADKVESM
ncbi:uncharacterized protein LOC117107770 [Anneissia japonica]|uniref:uncharacterized protein LOC117107770 n=1 Tax=Anneissia japonica TaxID=1529436 RepID=UPI0014259444|nr:uncharacterized protein LOC117107770 [Anneissia japonica]